MARDRWYGISGVDANGTFTWAPLTRSSGGGTVTNESPLTGRPRMWSDKSRWVFRSHSNDLIDPNSAQIVNYLKQGLTKTGKYILGCNIMSYSINFYYADASTPRQDIRITEQWASSKVGPPHGYTRLPDGTYVIPNVPVPAGASGADGSDGSAAIFDPDNNRIIECWILQPDTVRGGNYLQSMQGGHVDSVSTWDARWTPGLGVSGSGLGMSQTCLTVDDFMVGEQQGYFGRAIYFAIDQAWVTGTWRYPATRTDGFGGATYPYLEEGMRFILPSSFNVANYPTLTPFAKMVAENMRQGHPLVLADRISGGGGATSLEGASGLVHQFPSIFPTKNDVRNYYLRWFGGRDEWTQFTDFPWNEVIVIDKSVTF